MRGRLFLGLLLGVGWIAPAHADDRFCLRHKVELSLLRDCRDFKPALAAAAMVICADPDRPGDTRTLRAPDPKIWERRPVGTDWCAPVIRIDGSGPRGGAE